MIHCLLLLSSLLAGQVEKPAGEELKSDVRRLVRQLDAAELAQREAAEAELLNAARPSSICCRSPTIANRPKCGSGWTASARSCNSRPPTPPPIVDHHAESRRHAAREDPGRVPAAVGQRDHRLTAKTRASRTPIRRSK